MICSPTENSRPSLVPAVVVRGVLTTGVPGDEHLDVLERLPCLGVDGFIAGFVTHDGIFMNRKRALRFARRHNLLTLKLEDGQDELHSCNIK